MQFISIVQYIYNCTIEGYVSNLELLVVLFL
jgi:hypothetical protein